MKISCPHCGQSYDIDRTSIGKEADCTSCGNHFVIEANMQTDTPVLEPTSNDLENDRSDLIASIVRQYLRPGDGELMRRALEIVIGERKASTSYFQRRLVIGYKIASELVDELERRGILGGPTVAGGKREILLPPIQEELPSKNDPLSRSVAHCPYCAGEIIPGVKKCRHCGEWIDVSAKPKDPVVYVILGLIFGYLALHNIYAGEKERIGIKLIVLFVSIFLICPFLQYVTAIKEEFIFLFCAFGLNEIISWYDIATCHKRLLKVASEDDNSKTHLSSKG